MASNWGLNTTIDTNDKHSNGLGNTGPEKTAATTKGIGSKSKEQSTADDLDDTVDTSGEQGHLSTGHTETLEDLGSVVVDGVDSSHLLADHEKDRDYGTLSVAGDGDHLPPESGGSGITSEQTLVLELRSHLADLVLDVIGVGGELSKNSQVLGGQLPVILASAPSRAITC